MFYLAHPVLVRFFACFRLALAALMTFFNRLLVLNVNMRWVMIFVVHSYINTKKYDITGTAFLKLQ